MGNASARNEGDSTQETGRIKAIETRYKGYRFRSRLEARWAVFFDAMGIRWEYEPEGYTDGTSSYLPDFLLPEGACYVEVKPEGFRHEAPEDMAPHIERWAMLTKGSGLPILVLFGPPRDHTFGTVITFDPHCDTDWNISRGGIGECRRCNGWGWESDLGYRLVCTPGCNSDRPPYIGERVRAAVAAARGARFERVA